MIYLDPKYADFVLKVFAGPWLGHGRATEAFMVLACLVHLSSVVLSVDPVGASRATQDLPYYGWPGFIIFVPFAVIALCSGLGLWFNIRGISHSQLLRFLGALVGVFTFVWYAWKFIHIDENSTLGFAFCIVYALKCTRIMGMSLANRPVPGYPSQL